MSKNRFSKRPSGRKPKQLPAKPEAVESPGKIFWEPGAMLSPVPPVLVTCGQDDTANVITVAWTGILCTKPPKTYISLRPQRHSYGIIKETRQFVINLPPAKLAREVDLCGVKSGADTNKLTLCGLETVKASKVGAPILKACPVSLECKLDKIVRMGSHDMFVADIVAVAVSPEYIDRAGKLMIDKCGLLAYAHGTYFELGKALGSFGFSVRKKK